MSLTYRFFNSVDSDRLYDASDWAAYFASLVTNGVCHEDDCKVSTTAESVSGYAGKLMVGSGSIIINGYMAEVDEDGLEITVPASDGAHEKTDLVVAQLDMSNRQISIYVKASASGVYTAPALTQTATVYELALATVTVPAGATVIDTITDVRMDENYCGLSSVRFDGNTDVTQFFSEWSVKMQTLYAAIQSQLTDDQATWLQSQLNNLMPTDYSGTLTSAGWTLDETNGWYYQDFYQSTVSEASKFYADVDMSGATTENASLLQDAWSLVGRAYATDGSVRFICYDSQPDRDIPFILRMVKYTSLSS